MYLRVVYFDGTRVARRQLVYNDISAGFIYTLTNARNGSLETQAEECVVSRGESLMCTCQRAFEGGSRGASRHLLTIGPPWHSRQNPPGSRLHLSNRSLPVISYAHKCI